MAIVIEPSAPSTFPPAVFGDTDREPPPAVDGRREEALRLGLSLFIGTVAMLFAAFASAYLVRRSGVDWAPSSLPAMLWLNTAALVVSSLALEIAVRDGRQRRWPAANRALVAAVLLGLTFLGGQIVAWREMFGVGIGSPTGPHEAFFFLLTGVHGIHVVGALGVLVAGLVQTLAGAGRRNLARWMVQMDLVRTFWHFLLGLWVCVFALLGAL